MLKYLIYTKGQTKWFSWGQWTETLTKVKNHIKKGIERGLISEQILVLERKSPYDNIYRIKKLIDGKWENSKYIDIYKNKYAEPIYKFIEENGQEYIKYRKHYFEENRENISMIEWATRNDIAIRDLILWLYNNNYVTIRRK